MTSNLFAFHKILFSALDHVCTDSFIYIAFKYKYFNPARPKMQMKKVE